MNNTVMIWIVLPVLMGIALSFVRRWQRLYHWLSMLLPLLLTGLAFIFSSDLALDLAGRRFVMADSLTVLGRTIQITADQLGMVGLLYFLCFLWNVVRRLFPVSQWFGSLSLVVTGLWVLVQFLNPFIYSAVVIELIALLSVPLLSPRGTPAKSGIIRFLSMQTIALPLILLSGWMVSGIETSPSAESLVLRGALLVSLGFVIWAGIFPLHSWLPMLTEESQPLVSTFLLTMMQLGLVFFFLKFFNQYGWLRNLPQMNLSLKWIGALCILAAGLIAAFQSNLNRLLGYLFMAEVGYTLLSIALRGAGGLEVLAMTLLPRSLGFWMMGFSLSMLQQAADRHLLTLENLRGYLWRYPASSVLLLFGILNLTGMPLFGLYPSKHILWNLLPIDTLPLSLLVAVGVLGMIVFFLRLFDTFIHQTLGSAAESASETKTETVSLIVSVVIIVTIMFVSGLFPSLLSAPTQNILTSFQNLMR